MSQYTHSVPDANESQSQHSFGDGYTNDNGDEYAVQFTAAELETLGYRPLGSGDVAISNSMPGELDAVLDATTTSNGPLAYDAWTSELNEPIQTLSNWAISPAEGPIPYIASRSQPLVPADIPFPVPIDPFGSQASYPYALERSCQPLTWDNNSPPMEHSPYLLYPANAYSTPSFNTSSTLPVLPVTLAGTAQMVNEHGKRHRISSLTPTPDPSLAGPSSQRKALAMRNAKQKNARGKRAKKNMSEGIISPSKTSGFSLNHVFKSPQSSDKSQESSSTNGKRYENEPKRRVGRQGPLTIFQKEKIEGVRYMGACWRCRRYKKPCNIGALICNHCLTSGLRLWPGSLGCRRGDFTLYADTILPNGTEEAMKSIYPLQHQKPNNWRCLKLPPRPLTLTNNPQRESKWSNLFIKMQNLNIFGPELIELLEIMETLAQSSEQHSKLLELIATSCSYTADFYWCFVSTITPLPEPDLIETIKSLRTVYTKAWNAILSTCLTGKMNKWPAAFISACVVVCTLVVFTDTIVVIPSSARLNIWPDARTMIQGLRDQLYGAVIELLVVLAKGAKPLKFKCWVMEDAIDAAGQKTKVRNAEGLKWLLGDESAFDAMASLQAWAFRNQGKLENDDWFQSKPFSPETQPISSVSRFVIRTGGAYI